MKILTIIDVAPHASNVATRAENYAERRSRVPTLCHVACGSKAAVAGRRMAQPVYPQLRKYPERSGTYASCQGLTTQAQSTRTLPDHVNSVSSRRTNSQRQ